MASRGAYVLTLVLGSLMVVQAVLGLLYPTQYLDAESIRATWFGNDLVTLVIAAPLLVVSALRSYRGSVRWLLSWLGVLGYALYNYAFYLFGATLNVFFLLYIAAAVSAGGALIVALSSIDAGRTASAFRAETPVRVVGGSLIGIALGLGSIWIAMWAAYVFADTPTPVDPEAFKLVAALDLSLMVPALLCGGMLLWRRSPWGFIAASIAAIQGSLYLLVLSLNSFVAIHRGFAQAPGQLPVWTPLAMVMIALTAILIANVRNEPPRTGVPTA